jgi:hypothetical protein
VSGGPHLDHAALLRMAASVLQSRMPIWQAKVMMHGQAYRARFEWPGFVTVADDDTGELLARSLPGKPAEPDADTLARLLLARRL